MHIISIAEIEREARSASKKYSNVNDCCPYPFDTDAGRTYRNTFEAACKHVDDAIATGAALNITHSLDQFEPVPNPVPQPEYQALVTVSGWAR